MLELFDHNDERQERFNLVNDQEYADIKDKLQKSLYMKIGIEV